MDTIIKCLANDMAISPTITYDIDDRLYRVLRDYNTIRFNPNTTERHEEVGKQILRLCREADIRGLPPRPRPD